MNATTSLSIRAPAGHYAMIAREVDQRDDERTDTGEEAALAAGLRAREPEALRAAYERFGGVTFGFLVRTLGDRQLAEDVQQQVFLEVWQRAPTFDRDRGRLLSWVMMIARSRAIDQLRRRVPEPVGDPGEGSLEAGVHAEPDEVETLVERYRVASLLSGLPAEERRLLKMRFFGDLTQREIAERTGIPLGTVKMKMVRALERLRQRIEAEG